MLNRCVNCGFYVSNFEPECLRCGRQTSRRKKAAARLRLAPLPVFFAAFFAAILAFPAALFWFGQPFEASNYATFAAIIFVFLFLLFFRLEIKKHEFENERASSEPLTVLDKNSAIIEKRLAELDRRGREIDAVLDKIKAADGENLQEMRRKLLSAREVVAGQAARYELKKQAIRLVNLQTEVAPLLFKFHRLSATETENGLGAIETAQAEIGEIRRHLTDYAAIDFSGKSLNEKRDFLAQLTATENSCEKLRAALLNRQAARALKGISPIEEEFELPNTEEIAHAAETFNIEASLTDFSESFAELEYEYRRLRSESAKNQSFINE